MTARKTAASQRSKASGGEDSIDAVAVSALR